MHRAIELRDRAVNEVMDHVAEHPNCYENYSDYMITCKMMEGVLIMDNFIEKYVCNDTPYASELKENVQCRITKEMANKWLATMKNDDGSDGAHWTIQETNKVAELCNVKFEHIKDYEWNVVMNMMYSDHYHTAKSCNKQSDVVFFGGLAKEFLFDKDGKAPSERLYFFWKDVVKH